MGRVPKTKPRRLVRGFVVAICVTPAAHEGGLAFQKYDTRVWYSWSHVIYVQILIRQL